MKALVFLDIDGTILPEGKSKVPKDIIATIEEIKSKGHVPFICTGRNVGSAMDIINQVGVDSYVTSNGQQVTVGGEVIYSSYFPQEELEFVSGVIHEFTPNIAIENNEGLNVEDTETGRDLLKLIIGHGFFDSQALSKLPTKEVFQVWAFGTKEQLDGIMHELKGKAELYRWSDSALEIAPGGSGKGSGIMMAKRYFGENVRTFGFGDGVNDFSMMDVVDISVAMGNAVIELKQKCDYTTTDCEDGGVEKALRHFEVI
ncbi:HAD-IIB family hydrolase [Mollicutes bacterium LVI A0039]|nr:HAD-IIB family hydrolase [Mollicutes bacterium LVI A0039]